MLVFSTTDLTRVLDTHPTRHLMSLQVRFIHLKSEQNNTSVNSNTCFLRDLFGGSELTLQSKWVYQVIVSPHVQGYEYS